MTDLPPSESRVPDPAQIELFPADPADPVPAVAQPEAALAAAVAATGPLDPIAALTDGVRKFQRNVATLVTLVAPPVVVIAAVQLVGVFAVRGLVGFLGFYVLALLVAPSGLVGIFRAALLLTNGEPLDVASAIRSDRAGAWVTFSIVYGFLLALGGCVCIVGALAVVAYFGLAPFYVLDRGMAVGDALLASLQTTRAHDGLPFALALTALVGCAGFAVCIVGALVTVPVAVLAAAWLYRTATGQAVAP